MSKPVHHVLDVYDTQLHLAFDSKTWKRLRRRHNFLEKNPNASGMTGSALWVPKVGVAIHHVAFYIDLADHGDDFSGLANTCAHEAAHGAARILRHVHQPITDDEALAYLVGWLTGWMLDEAAKVS